MLSTCQHSHPTVQSLVRLETGPDLPGGVLRVAAESPGVEEGAVRPERGQHDVRHQIAQVRLPRPHRAEPSVQLNTRRIQLRDDHGCSLDLGLELTEDLPHPALHQATVLLQHHGQLRLRRKLTVKRGQKTIPK